ncbi:MAG: hypothetical protein QW372_03085 [Nitrososphaerales archaeon]
MSERLVSVIIPTREKVREEVLKSIPEGIPILIGVDKGEGQTKIRHRLAKIATTKYILLLDDDIVLPNNGIDGLLNTLITGRFDAVCGEVEPIALNKFSKSILKFKVNPSSFYTTGITIWDREKFLEVMNEIPPNCHKHIGDLMIRDIAKSKRLRFFKVHNVVAKHLIELNWKDFFKYRLSCAEGIGEYYKMKGGYWRLLLKVLIAIPLSTSFGVFIYRLATFLGMLKKVFK